MKTKYLILAVFTLAAPGFAHHAMEYIRIESYTTAMRGQFVLHLHYDHMVEDKNNPYLDHSEFTPGLSYGITSRLMIDGHFHVAKFGMDHVLPEFQDQYAPQGPSPFVEAAAFALQYRLTEGWPVDIAVAVVYEIPFNRSKELLDGQQVIEGLLILSKTFSNHANICLNLKYGKDGDETVQEWGLGFKTPLTSQSHGISAGIEILGDFKSGDISVMPGVYMPLGAENIILKTGVEFGVNNDSLKVNGSLMYLF